MSRGRHAKPSSLPSASTTLAAAAPAVLVVAAAAPGAGHQAAPAASAPGAAAPAASAGLSPSGTVRALRMQAARASAHPSWVMATVHVRSGNRRDEQTHAIEHHHDIAVGSNPQPGVGALVRVRCLFAKRGVGNCEQREFGYL